MEGLDNPVYSKDVIEFVTVANEFCKFLENSLDIKLVEFIDKTHRVLPLLYLKGTLLPVIEEPYEEFNEKHVSEDDYNFLHESFLGKFGTYNYYDEIFDPLRQENDELAQSSLAENFADIYQDLKDFLLQFRIGTDEVMLNAVWECKQSFEQYWGQRIVNIMRVLHNLKYVVVDLKENDDENTNKEQKDIDTSNWLISKRQGGVNDE